MNYDKHLTSGEDMWKSIAEEAKEIEKGKEKVETMEDLLEDIDTSGGDDRDTMDSIVQEITKLEEKIDSAMAQREQIASKKKELTLSAQLETNRNGIDR